MTASQRLSNLGITLPAVATPAGAYVPALRHGDLIMTSGQLPLVDGTLHASGIVGDAVDLDTAVECARLAALNALAAAAHEAGGIDRIVRVVKITGFVASHPIFTDQPQVLNGASHLMGEIFGTAGAHVRSAVGVATLPLGAPVEVELTVAVN